MKVLGVTGMPGSGKSVFIDTALEKYGIVVSMGDIIREKARERGEDTGTTAKKIREEFGQYIVSELTVERIKEILKEDNEADFILVDGIRSPYEVEMFKENFDNFSSVSIFACAKTRFERLLIRNRADDSDNYGLRMFSDEYYDSICKKAYAAGFQVCTHAIGDAGVRTMLNIYGSVLKGENDRRWRIEHSQVVHPDDFTLYKKYSIIPSIQTTHATSDMNWAEERLGARVKNAYAYRRLLEQNGWLINGTDFPIENISPLYTFFAAVARQDLNGNPPQGWQMENALSREEALRSITCWVAKGYFEETTKGSIEKGKEADFVILNRDIMTIPLLEIPNTKVKRLFLSGKEINLKASSINQRL